MGQYWQEYFQSPKMLEIASVADYDNLANRNPLQFEPGEKFLYSNCGPLVLGLIIEKISGMSYYDYVKKHVYKPAGMINSDCYDITTIVENLAVGYTKGAPMGRSFKEWHNNLGSHPLKGGPAGGGYSTVEDLLNFDIALRSGKLLSAENFKLMTSGKVARNEQTQYAYLFQEKFVNGHRIIGHNGGAGGINSHLAMYMDLGYTVAIMSNYDPPAAEKIASRLEELLAAK
jgi:D-alanyl-D-alanine carboxypeptidase